MSQVRKQIIHKTFPDCAKLCLLVSLSMLIYEANVSKPAAGRNPTLISFYVERFLSVLYK